MNFFEYFPKEYYTLDNNKNALDIVTNISLRFKINESIKTNSSAFYEYVVQDNETPEQIAYKVYGNPNKHWIILMMNDIIEPQFDWIMSDNTLNRYIEKKYEVQANGSPVVEWSKSNIKSYYRQESRTNTITKISRREVIEVDANTYANVVSTSTTKLLESGESIIIKTDKFPETYYDYEVRLNNAKRTVKILKNEFVDAIVREVEEIFSQ